MPGHVDAGEQQVTELVLGRLGRQLAQLLLDLGERPGRVGPVESDRGSLALDLGRVQQRRQRRRDPVHHALPLLLGFLDLLPVGHDLTSGRRVDIAEHVRVAVDQLVVDPAGHVGQREPALLGRQRRVEVDLEQQVAQLLFQMVDGIGASAVETLDRLDQLVGLLDHVPGQALVGLLAIPRTALAQRPHQFGEPHQLGANRLSQRRDVEAGQVVGLERTIEVVPRDLDDRLVRQAQPLQRGHAVP